MSGGTCIFMCQNFVFWHIIVVVCRHCVVAVSIKVIENLWT